MDSTELVRVAKQGDDEAFFQLVSCHKEKLYRIALGYLKNEEDALEAVHEATCRAYTKLHKLRKPQFLVSSVYLWPSNSPFDLFNSEQSITLISLAP
jgi:RNA polymerase sigma-70 factor (ECF subfamily)